MSLEPRAYQRFFAELKRRRVFNTAAVYGGVTFIVIQAADFMVPALRLPEVVSTIIAVVAIVGFPISMVLAWTYDVSAGGFQLTLPPLEGELEEIVALSPIRRWPTGIGAAVGVILLLGGVWWQLSGGVGSVLSAPVASDSNPVATDSNPVATDSNPVASDSNPVAPDSNPVASDAAPVASEPTLGSVAVVPFLTLSGEEGGEYLGEGIAAELLHALRRVPGLQVTARTSVFSSGNGPIDLPTVGGHPSVESVLEGSVVRSEDQVEIAVQVVSAEGGDRIWSQSYRLPEAAFLPAFDDIAWSIASALGVAIPATDRGRLVQLTTESFAAYDDYLRGRYFSLRSTPEAVESAIEYFNRALLLDPDFMAAWGALATAYVQLPEVGGPPMMEVLPYAEASLKHAMTPGRETAEGYAALAYLKWTFHWDLRGAEADFQRSIDLEPHDPTPRVWYAQLLATQRRWDEGLAEVNRALDLDPSAPQAYFTLGMLLMCADRDGAAAAFRRALELAPAMHPAAYVLAGHLAMEGDLEGAAVEFDRFSALTGSDPSVFRAYLNALSDPSRRPEAVAALQGPALYGPVQGAELLAHLGEHDAAIALLEQSVQARSPYLPWVNAMPQYNEFRSDPRLQSILAWVG